MSGFVPESFRTEAKTKRLHDTELGDEVQTQSRGPNVLPDMSGGAAAIAADNGNGLPQEIEISASQKMLSAVSGSLLTSLLVTPLDVVRVRLQSQPHASSLRNLSFPSTGFNNASSLGVTACCREVFWVNNNSQFCIATPTTSSLGAISGSVHTSTVSAETCAVEETRQKAFTSTFDGLRKIARNEGFLTLWRGLSPTLVMAIPANVIYFTGYDHLRYSPRSPIRNYVSDGFAPLAAGAVARVSAAFVVSPIEMFRTRMQASSGGSAGIFTNTLSGLRGMVATQGYTSLWRGLTLTMWRDVPFSGFYWWGYEAVRNSLTDVRERSRGRTLETLSASTQRSHMRSRSRSQDNHTATFVDSFIAGATSGAVASIVTTPFDVGKTRQQVFVHASDLAGKVKSGGDRTLLPEQRSMPRFLYHIFRTEGVAGLFRGWAARCLKVAPACAIMISSYEIGKKMAHNVNNNVRLEDGNTL